jgi:cleavage stimulation factor subunit 3
MHNLDNLWHEYESFENEFAKPTAKQTIAESMPRYKAAWQKYKEKKNIREGLLLNMLARPPRGSMKEEQQKKIWKHLISFEKRNTQRLSMEEVRQRVMFTYEQALLCLYHYPEVWFEASMYLASFGANEDASKMFERAIKALPDNILLHFAYADHEETKKNYNRAQEVYQTLLQHRQDSIIYIQYQKFTRRRFGVEKARQVFVQAAKAPTCTYHVYVASALMEFQVNKNAAVAVKVFERGLKNPKFMNEPAFILEYLKLLEHLNDRNNTRVLFKKVLGSMPKDKSLEIWNKFLEFEFSVGEPSAITEVEQSKNEVYEDRQEEKKFVDIVDRFKFMDLWPCGSKELEVMDDENDMEIERNFGGIFQFYNQPSTTSSGTPKIGGLKRSSKVDKELAKATINRFKSQFYKPDTFKMLKITPSDAQSSRPVLNDGSLPDAIANLLPLIPNYNGPLPDIEIVLGTLRNNPLPPQPREASTPSPTLERTGGVKRPREEEEEDGGPKVAPQLGGASNDIYQMRRKKQRNMQSS